MAGYRDTGICIRPQAGTGSAYFRIPLAKFSLSDAVLGGDIRTAFILFDKVELITVVDNARLNRGRGLDALIEVSACLRCSQERTRKHLTIGGFRRRRLSLRSCRCFNRGTPVALDTVGFAYLNLTAVVTN